MTSKLLAKRLADHAEYLETAGGSGRQLQLRQLNLRGVDLHGVDLSNCELIECNFTGANLEGTMFSRAIVVGSVFREASFSGSYFFKANLDGTDMRAAMITRCDLTRATLSGATLRGAVLDESYLFKTFFWKTDLSNCSFRNVDLERQFVAGIIDEDTPFEGAAGRILSEGLNVRSESSIRHLEPQDVIPWLTKQGAVGVTLVELGDHENWGPLHPWRFAEVAPFRVFAQPRSPKA